MMKILICAIVLSTTANVAIADTVTDVRPDLTVSHPHNYWLSDGLNRLAFWQAPLQTGRSVARTPQDGKSIGARSGG